MITSSSVIDLQRLEVRRTHAYNEYPSLRRELKELEWSKLLQQAQEKPGALPPAPMFAPDSLL